MLEIFICEDQKKQREDITEFIKNYIMIEKLDMKVTLSTAKPESVLDYVKSNTVTGLYFLDVELKAEMTGIELASYIRKYDKRGVIVFITAHPQYVSITFEYGVEAMDYITKGNLDVMKNKIIKCIHLANDRLLVGDEERSIFQIKSGERLISEPYDKIMFFEISEKQKNKITMHATTRQVEFYSSLSEIEKLSIKFFPCHRSCLVNIDNIVDINVKNREIKMSNGQTCEASTRGIKSLLKVWTKSDTTSDT